MKSNMTGELYIASSLLNKDRVQALRDKFAERGIGLTYDWTTHGWVKDVELLADVALQEAAGVIAAKCVLMVVPARNGTHTEFGIAWTLKKPIVMLVEDPDNHVYVSFHKLPEVMIVHTEAEAMDLVERIITTGFVYDRHSINTLLECDV